MTGLYDQHVLDALQAGAVSVLGRWGLPQDADVRLLTISENATFLVRDPASDAPTVLRVHRPGYHTREEITSELDWISDIHRQGIVETPAIVECLDGERIAHFADGDDIRHVVAFSFMSGREPDAGDDLVSGFAELGAITARLHGHARAWTRPTGFVRKIWDVDTTLGDQPHWGHWRAAQGLDQAAQSVLQRTVDVLRQQLADYGSDASRFGLIHADLRLANLLVDGRRLGVIDFDDCGFGWYVYDFAARHQFHRGRSGHPRPARCMARRLSQRERAVAGGRGGSSCTDHAAQNPADRLDCQPPGNTDGTGMRRRLHGGHPPTGEPLSGDRLATGSFSRV